MEDFSLATLLLGPAALIGVIAVVLCIAEWVRVVRLGKDAGVVAPDTSELAAEPAETPQTA